MTSSELLQQAIAAAKAGRRAQALVLLWKVVEQEPRNELAWLCLSDQAEDPDEQILALENALNINPHNASGRERLEKLRGQQRADQERRAAEWQERLGQAQKAIKAARRAEARDILLQLVQEDERNETAWFLLSDLVTDIRDQMVALENTLTLNPNHARAKSQLARLQSLQQDPLALGAMYEERGENDLAVAAYITASMQARSSAEREQVQHRLEAVQTRLADPKINIIPPWLTVIRLAAGPSLLYGLLIVLQSGLNPPYVPALFWLAGLGVVLGSMLIVAVTLKPQPPIWLSILRRTSGAGEPVALLGLELLGWLLLLLPYLLFSLKAVERLNYYRALLSQVP